MMLQMRQVQQGGLACQGERQPASAPSFRRPSRQNPPRSLAAGESRSG